MLYKEILHKASKPPEIVNKY